MVDDLLAGCAVLDGEGLTTAFGHLSLRTSAGTVLVSGNQGPGLVTSEEDIVELELDGSFVSGEQSLRAGEVPIHLGILAARPDVASVCRFHGPASMAFSTLGRPLPATIGMALFLGAEVPLFDTSRTVTTLEHGAELTACLGDAGGILLRGFGAATVGRTVAEAVVRAWLLERSAAAVLAASAVDEPLAYPPAAAEPFQSLDGPAAGQVSRAWRYLCHRHPRSTR
jgi:ribulose-5-phosphate 4-epimerase/fuculose-1-phosphate aldolase